MRLILLLGLVAVVAGCTQSVRTHTAYQERPNVTARGSDPVRTVGTPLSPIQFLDVLERSRNNTIMVFGESRNWILASDVRPLLSRLYSQTPCAGVVSSYSSHMPPSDFRSTVGHEAALLIEGFRCGYYPPVGSSDQFHLDILELKGWYETWSTNRQASK